MQSAMRTFASAFLKYILSGIIATPPESVADLSLRISLLCRSSFRGRAGLWLFMLPKSYSDMCDWYITASPPSTRTKASFICALPARRLFISVPVSAMPASKVSPTKYSRPALRLRISVNLSSFFPGIAIKKPRGFRFRAGCIFIRGSWRERRTRRPPRASVFDFPGGLVEFVLDVAPYDFKKRDVFKRKLFERLHRRARAVFELFYAAARRRL